MSKNNFYDSLLLQDGHELMKIKPPRDFTSWFNLRVQVIANRKPVAVTDMSETTLRNLLNSHPYNSFPV
jgi:hypothetical protein